MQKSRWLFLKMILLNTRWNSSEASWHAFVCSRYQWQHPSYAIALWCYVTHWRQWVKGTVDLSVFSVLQAHDSHSLYDGLLTPWKLALWMLSFLFLWEMRSRGHSVSKPGLMTRASWRTQAAWFEAKVTHTVEENFLSFSWSAQDLFGSDGMLCSPKSPTLCKTLRTPWWFSVDL